MVRVWINKDSIHYNFIIKEIFLNAYIIQNKWKKF